MGGKYLYTGVLGGHHVHPVRTRKAFALLHRTRRLVVDAKVKEAVPADELYLLNAAFPVILFSRVRETVL